MFHQENGLTPDKQSELERAFQHAQRENLGAEFKLQASVHPVTREFGLTVPATAPQIGEANLVIVQHQDTGVVQFVFPVQAAQPLTQDLGSHNFAFIRPRQLGTALGDAAKWMVKAALKIPEAAGTDAIWILARTVEALITESTK